MLFGLYCCFVLKRYVPGAYVKGESDLHQGIHRKMLNNQIGFASVKTTHMHL